MVKKILILPYFGKFNNYFHLWINSCQKNPNTDFLIITDNPRPKGLKKNIYWVQKDFNDLKEQFRIKLGFSIWLERPYKLCDYKVYYGFLFQEYLEGYDFWGYCDCDVIFGQLDDFLSDEMFEKYDKLLGLGHLSFVRNTFEVNTLFRKYDTYRIALSTPIMYGQDEVVTGYHLGFAGELIEQGFRVYHGENLPADIDFRHYPFRVVKDPHKCCVFAWENGRLYKLYRVEGRVIKEESAYIHLQKRKMQVENGLDHNRFLIWPNTFGAWDEDMLQSPDFWEKVEKEQSDYFDWKKEHRELLFRDVRRLLHEPQKLDCLRYRFKKGKYK